MRQKEEIRKMANYLFRNSRNVTAPGLYNGKAGVSLSLFIASKYLQDEELEDRAYRLLQESIIHKNDDLSFENGLAGIGYALLYLSENQYVEADFHEIFPEQYEKIIKINIGGAPLLLLNSLQLVYFLSKAGKSKEDHRTGKIIEKIFEGVEVFLTVQFHDFTDIQYTNNKTGVLNIYTTYLKLIDYSGYAHFSRLLPDDYAALYQEGKIVSSLETGYYLKKITDSYHIKGYEDVINENICNGAKGAYPCTLTLKERVDMAKLTGDRAYEIPANMPIQNLLKTVDKNSYPLGYGAGLGRLLIYLVDKDIELL